MFVEANAPMRPSFQKQAFKRKYGDCDDGTGTPKSRRISSDQFYKLAIPFPITIDARCIQCKRIDMAAGSERFKVDANGYLVEQKTYCPECVQDKITIANAMFRISKRHRDE